MSVGGHFRFGSDSDVSGRDRDFRSSSNNGHSPAPRSCPFRAKTGLMHCDKRKAVRLLPRHGQAMAAMTRLATVDQLLRKALAVLDASGTADGFNNLGGRNIMDKISQRLDIERLT